LDEGSDDEVSLRANRTHFDDIVIRPHFLINDVSTIDTSVTLLGKKLTQPIYLSITGGKNCFIPNGEQETALAAGTSSSMMITGGGINSILSTGKRP
jgi:L-lactate dehydrogenase (cytochrome)